MLNYNFCSIKVARSIVTPPGWDASSLQITPQHSVHSPQQLACTYLYTWVERGIVKVKGFAQEHEAVP